MRSKILFLILLTFFQILPYSPAYADTGFFNGVSKTLLSSLELPKAILEQSNNLPFGLVTGALTGTYRAVAGTVSGVGEMVQGAATGAMTTAQAAAPYAKYAWLAFL